MTAFSISRAWDETKAAIAADGRLFAIVAAALLLLPQAILAVVAPPEELSGVAPPGWVNLLAIAAALIGIIAQIAIIRLAQLPGSSVGEAISHGLKRLLPVIGALLLLVIALFLLAVPLMLLLGGFGALEGAGTGAMARSAVLAAAIILILAILVGPRLLMIMPVATAEPGGPVHVLKRSWSLSAGHYFRLLAFVLLILVAAVVIVGVTQLVGGSVLALMFGELRPLSVGALLYGLVFGAFQAAFGVVITVMLARIYVQLTGREALDVTVPRTGT